MICGDIMTMPGLPKVPAANSIDVDDERAHYRSVLRRAVRAGAARIAGGRAADFPRRHMEIVKAADSRQNQSAWLPAPVLRDASSSSTSAART